MNFVELPPQTRHNFPLEALYETFMGLAQGLLLMAPVVAANALKANTIEMTAMVAATPVAALLMPFWTQAARAHRLQRLVIVSGLLRVVPLVAVSLVHSAAGFVALLLLDPFVAGPLLLAVPSLYKYNYPDSHRARLIGWLRFVSNAALIPVMLGASLLIDYHPELYRLLYPLGGMACLAAILCYSRLRIPNDRPRERSQTAPARPWRELHDVLEADQAFRLFQSSVFLTGAAFMVSRHILLITLRDEYHLTTFALTFLMMALPQMLGGLTSPFWGAFIDRTNPVRVRVVFCLLAVAAYAFFFASMVTHSVAVVYVASILRGIAIGGGEVTYTTGNIFFAAVPQRVTLYNGVAQLLQGVRGLVMPVVGSVAFTMVGGYVFLLSTGFSVVSWVLAVKVARMVRLEPPEARLPSEAKGERKPPAASAAPPPAERVAEAASAG